MSEAPAYQRFFAELKRRKVFRVMAVYGGVGYGPQLDALREGAHIVVGTPGRILDHLMRKSMILDGLDIVAKTAGNMIIEEELQSTRQAISEGKTIAELGNRNRPLDMITYTNLGYTNVASITLRLTM